MRAPLPLLVLVPALLGAGHVHVDGARFERLLGLDDPDEPGALGPVVLQRRVELTVVDPEEGPASLLVEATWLLASDEPAWFHGLLIGPAARIESVRWNGRQAQAHALRHGYAVIEELASEATVELRATLPWTPGADSSLRLLPAAIGGVKITAKGVPVLSGPGVVAAPGAGFWAATEHLQLRVDPEPAAPPPSLVLGELSLGLTAGDATLRGEARLRFTPRRGSVERVAFRHHGLGDDLRVEGPLVRAVSRGPDRVEVELLGPASDLVELDLSWTRPLPTGDEASTPLPRIEPEGVLRTTTWLQLARDGDREVLAELPAWQPVASSRLPEWGTGLIGGTPVTSWTSPAPADGRLTLFRFTPADGPAAVVDVADYTVATSSEGRVLLKARYDVRSDRAAHLRVRAPAGARLLSLRVEGEALTPARDGERWLVPLKRSVETTDGLLAFPVELVLLFEDAPWGRRDRRELPLPRLDAPVAVQRATVHLPPGWKALGKVQGERVSGFSEGEGIRYGFQSDDDADQADALFGAAVQAWKSNEFRSAQGYLDELDRRGARSDKVGRLQGNLDLLDGKKDVDVATKRRVLGQAKARAGKDQARYERARREVRKKLAAGDQAAAETAYQEAAELNEKLVQLQDGEDADLEEQSRELSRAITEALPTSSPPPRPPRASAPREEPAPPTFGGEPAHAAATEAPRAPAPVVAEDLTRFVPAGDDLGKFDYGDPVAEGRGGLGISGTGVGGGGSGYGMGMGSMGSRSAGVAVQVAAATRAVAIPRLGAPLLFQRLLLPADAEPTLRLHARRL